MSRILKGLSFLAGAGVGIWSASVYNRKQKMVPAQIHPQRQMEAELNRRLREQDIADEARQNDFRKALDRISVLERSLLEQSISIRTLRASAEPPPPPPPAVSFEAQLGRALGNPQLQQEFREPGTKKPGIPIARILVALLALGLSHSALTADEGLWPYNQFPVQAIKQKYAFDTSDTFLNELRLSSVRIGSAGAGSFVSPKGLLLTTRQMVAACLPNLQDAFSGEQPCPGLEATVLLNIEDVTAQLKSATSVTQRNAAIARLEADCTKKVGDQVCSVVALFSGGRYDLYHYKRYSELHLLFAPEYSVAFFGKERDSITYLRYGLNIAFLRAYENGAPAITPHYLKWSKEGVRENDLVFAAGDPKATARSVTAAQLTFYRDTALPLSLSRVQGRLQQLNSFAALSDENMRAAQPVLTPMLNSFKSDAGKLIGLRDDRLVTRKTVFEQKIRRAVEGDAKLGPAAAKVWDDVAAAYKKWAPFEKPYQILETAPAPGSLLFRAARQKLRGEKIDNPEPHPNNAIEVMMLTQYLEDLKSLGDKQIPLKNILQGKTSKQAAETMVQSSGQSSESSNGVAQLAAMLEPLALKLRKQHEEIIGSLEVSAAEKIAQYRFRLFGAAESPDGTGTPRVEFGTVTGYTDRAAVAQPFASTISGLFYRQNNDGPWQVPPAWLTLRSALNPVAPLDFVSTCDTGGGDYGSPVVNRAGDLVGVTFDGNLESLPNTFLYSSDQARSVHVDVRGIAEALEKVYKAKALLDELGIQPSAISPATVAYF